MDSQKCQRCGKAEAKIHVTEISPEGEKTQIHLCDACYNNNKESEVPSEFSLQELLSGIGKKEDVPDVTCPSCGMTLKKFINTERLGCANDYDLFKENIESRLEHFHDALQHVGRAPKGGTQMAERSAYLRSLRYQLNAAIAEEAFEHAARLRDEIKVLEEDNNSEEDNNDA